MLTRLFFGLVLGLIMYMPRPRRPESPPPIGAPGDRLPSSPDIEEGPWNDVLPHLPGDVEPGPRRPGSPGPTPRVPPTPPPGFDGEWPPASERPDVPPTPPPGHDGPWPDAGQRTIIEAIRELIRELRSLRATAGVAAGDARSGVERIDPPEAPEIVPL